jgi:YbgC/YbaW family acyl-CoA thioester hydrolase
MTNQIFSRFTTQHKVRPDDIDMFNHVHSSKYLDYVLAARYEQMDVNYGMAMEDFLKMGYGWVVKTAKVNFKRPLTLSDFFLVTTGLTEIHKYGCRILFEITNPKTNKTSADGYFEFVMISLKTGKAEALTPPIIEKYSI